MTSSQGTDDAADILLAWETTSWALAATIATLRDVSTSDSLAEALEKDKERTAVLEAAEIIRRDHGEITIALGAFQDRALAGSAAAARATSMRQAFDAATGQPSQAWATQPDEVLIGQGRASAATGHALVQPVAPTLDDLSDRLARSGSRVLDVGTGIGALALAVADALPNTHVTAIDNSERVLRVAERHLATGGPQAERVELRLQDAVDIDEANAYDLIWLPAPFLSKPVLAKALPRLVECLKNQGWLIVGTNPDAPSDLGRAVAVWVATRNGGSATMAEEMESSLTHHGLQQIRSVPTVPGGPTLVVGQKFPHV